MPKQYMQEKLETRIQTLEVGDKFISKSEIVPGALLDSFLNLIGIRSPLFLSDEYARRLGFKSRVSTGLLTFCQMMGMLSKAGFLRDGVYLGTDKCKHMLPVYPGDMIRVEVEVLDKRLTSKGNRLIITYKWQVKNQSDQVVSEGENTCMFPPPAAVK